MISAKILLDSITKDKNRLTTFEIIYPRIIMAELNTHRMLSRNSASSRAIPISKIIEQVENAPFVPSYWGKNQSGMQAFSEVSDSISCEKEWLLARDSSVKHARILLDLGVHKQLVNRILEPFLYVTSIVSATTFINFFRLREHKDAQPEIQSLALLMKEAYNKSIPDLQDFGYWHTPLILKDELNLDIETIKKISAARCARVSYLTHAGTRDISLDLELYDKLAVREDDSPKHLSPLEHVAVASKNEMFGNFKGWKQLRKYIEGESGEY